MLPGCVPWPEEFARRYRARGYWQGISLFEMLRQAAARTPGKTALVDGDRRLTYAELVRNAEDLAAGLYELGLRPPDRVIFQLGNSLELAATFFALMRIGVIPVMALPAHRGGEIGHWVEHAGAVAHFVAAATPKFDCVAMARSVAVAHPLIRYVVTAGPEAEGVEALAALCSRGRQAGAQAALAALPDPAADGVALMLLSGGTTGMPKLIPRTHNDYVHVATRTGIVTGFGPDTVFLAVLPMAHNYTLCCPGMLGTLVHGGTVIISSDTTAEQVFSAIARERVTAIGATVPLVARWLDSDQFGRHDLCSLRVFINGGAKLPPELRRRVEERFQCEYQENFGTGEGLVCITPLGQPEPVRFLSSGRPISEGDEIKVIDERGNELAEGQIGELAARGPYTIRGYYSADAANRDAFTDDGFYRTGDVVRVVDGFIYLEGRRKDLINRGGEKISCEEVEDYILAHPKVMSVCVVAMPDAVFGEKACAFAILREGCELTLEELVAFLQQREIARFKLPERLEIVDEFPISAAGKVLRRELRERIARQLQSERS